MSIYVLGSEVKNKVKIRSTERFSVLSGVYCVSLFCFRAKEAVESLFVFNRFHKYTVKW